jgi:hypothetical protein
MPAVSERQAHTARMALAYVHGKPITDFPMGVHSAVKSMAKMDESDLKEYLHTKKKRTLLTRESH